MRRGDKQGPEEITLEMRPHLRSASQPEKKRPSRGPVPRDIKEVMADLVGKLTEKLDPKAVSASAGEERPRGGLRPNLGRVTVAVDLGDQWSHYCILGLEGGDAGRRTVADHAKSFYGIFPGPDSGAGGHRSGDALRLGAGSNLRLRARVLVAKPRLMKGSKRRKR